MFDDTGAASTGMEQRRSLDSDEEASFDGPQWQTDYMFCDKANAMLVQHGTAVHQGTAVPKGREKLHETHSLSKVQHEKNNESPGISDGDESCDEWPSVSGTDESCLHSVQSSESSSCVPSAQVAKE